MEELCGRKNDRIPQREGRIKDMEMRFRSYLRISINVAEKGRRHGEYDMSVLGALLEPGVNEFEASTNGSWLVK